MINPLARETKVAILYTLMSVGLVGCAGSSEGVEQTVNTPVQAPDDSQQVAPPEKKITVKVGMMSRCDHAGEFLEKLISSVRKFGAQVELDLVYIGREESGALKSMLGADEVAGDKLQLCVRHHSPYERWLDFMHCQAGRWEKNLEQWQTCARQSQIDTSTICACVEGPEGDGLLRASFRAAQKLGAKACPSFYFGGDLYKGTRSEEAFSLAICAQFDDEPPPYCSELQEPVTIPAYVLGDRRCSRPECANPPPKLSVPTGSRTPGTVPGC